MAQVRQREFVKYWTVPRLYPDGTVYIIGGGPSLKGMDWAPLHEKRVIACNDAYRLGDWVDICFFGDYAWFDGTRDFPGHKQMGLLKFLGLKVSAPEHPIFDPRIKVLRRNESHQGLSPDPGQLCWNFNTGGTAIGLACHLGAKRIVLLGFDMKLGPDGSSNYHSDNKTPANQYVYSRYLETFPAIKVDLAKHFPGVEIINATPDSELRIFPCADLKDVLREDKPGKVIMTKTEPTQTLPKVETISVLCPTRQRAKLCHRFVKSFRDMADRPDALEIILYMDHDDPEHAQYRKWISGCRMIVGKLAEEGGDVVGKAWNLMAKYAKGSFLMMGNDDLIARTKGWDTMIRNQAERFRDRIILMWFDDKIHGKDYCAFPIVTARWYHVLGYFVPECFSFFCHDTWLFDIAKRIGRAVYVRRGVIEHAHFSTGKMERDETTARNRNLNQSKRDLEIMANTTGTRAEHAETLIEAMQEETKAYKLASDVANVVNGKRVIIVGPAPTLQGKGLGHVIDSYDVVCRVNEFLPYGCEEDYGSRTDVVITSGAPKVMRQLEESLQHNEFAASQLKEVIMTQLSHNEEDNLLGALCELHVRRKRVGIHHIGDGYWYRLARQIQCSPNTGFAGICLLLHYPITELTITGMSFFNKDLPFHSRGYDEWGGEYGGKADSETGVHRQEEQLAYLKDSILTTDDRVVVDSYLNDAYHLEAKKVFSLEGLRDKEPIYTPDETLASLVNGKRVIIVGPSPHLMDEGMGRAINRYDVVCRVNELLPFGHEEDYGNRTDIIFHCCGEYSASKLRSVMEQRTGAARKVKMIVCTQDREENPVPEKPFHFIGPFYWHQLNYRIGMESSTGILAVATLLEQYKPKELMVTGFSFYEQGLKSHERHNPGYIKWGGDHSAREHFKDHFSCQCSPIRQAPQKEFFKGLLEQHPQLRIDSYMKRVLKVERPNSMQLSKSVYAIYRVLYGADYIRESIRSIIHAVDKVFIFWTNKVFGDATSCQFKGSTITFPEVVDSRLQEMMLNIKECYPEKVEVLYDHWGIPDNQFSHLANDRVLSSHAKPDMFMFIEPDHVWRFDQLEKVFEEMDSSFESGAARQVELWKTSDWRIPERPRRVSTVFWNMDGLQRVPDTGKGGAGKKTKKLNAYVHNLGFCLNPEVMFWKHMVGLGFGQKSGDSMPNEDWYFRKWLTWNENGNNKDLEVAKGHESDIPFAVQYDPDLLPEVLR